MWELEGVGGWEAGGSGRWSGSVGNWRVGLEDGVGVWELDGVGVWEAGGSGRVERLVEGNESMGR